MHKNDNGNSERERERAIMELVFFLAIIVVDPSCFDVQQCLFLIHN